MAAILSRRAFPYSAAMGWLLAAIYDTAMTEVERACLLDWRAALLRHAAGDVLEVGAGTGANLQHYPEAVTRLVLAEPDADMRRRLRERTQRHALAPEVSAFTMEDLGYPDASFDVVVSTLVLCTVERPERALGEARRVLRPGGKLLFIEHVAAEQHSSRRRWQGRIEPLWRRMAGNCHLTRDTEQSITDAGFAFASLEHESLRRAFPFVRPSVRGVAVRS
jgi:ubiquinone/menaquinone biosynthesis C-methylase UbiE